jgi:acetolactate synthase small subunit
MKQTFSTDVRNAPGVLARVEGIFRRQNVPLESLVLVPTPDFPSRSRLTLVADVSAEQAGFLTKLLRRLIDVQEAGPARIGAPPTRTGD